MAAQTLCTVGARGRVVWAATRSASVRVTMRHSAAGRRDCVGKALCDFTRCAFPRVAMPKNGSRTEAVSPRDPNTHVPCCSSATVRQTAPTLSPCPVRLPSASLLPRTGGQRTLVSLALLLALAQCSSSSSSGSTAGGGDAAASGGAGGGPGTGGGTGGGGGLWLLDEVDAALDEHNQAAVARLLRHLAHGEGCQVGPADESWRWRVVGVSGTDHRAGLVGTLGGFHFVWACS